MHVQNNLPTGADLSAIRYPTTKAFAGPGALARAEEVVHWVRAALFDDEVSLRWCNQHRVPVVKAQGEDVGTSGGYVVPVSLADGIIILREDRGSFRRAASYAPMSSGSTNWPKRTGAGFTAYFPGENGQVTESPMSFGNVALMAKKIAALGKVSTELFEDSIISIAEFIASEMAYAFAGKEDSCGWYGDGSSIYGGMNGIIPQLIDGSHAASVASAASGHDTFAELDVVDLANLMSKIMATALPGARWFGSQFAFATVFCRLAASAGGIVMMPVNGRMTPHFMGFPVEIAQVFPQVATSLTGQTMLAFGDLSLAATLGERRGFTMKISTQRYMDNDQIGLLGTERVDIVSHSLGDATTAGPIAALLGN